MTGYNDAFIISQETRDQLIKASSKNAEIIRPILRGRDIEKYQANWANLFLIHVPWHFPLQNDPAITGASEEAEQKFKKQYPAIYKHLYQYKEDLLNRNKAETGIRYEWYALQRWGANYMEDFFRPKIIYPEITKFISFYLDNSDNYFVNNKCFILTGQHIEFLTAFLNSSLFKFCFLSNFPELLGGTRELRKIFLEKIPVKEITEKQNQFFAKKVQKIQDLKSQNANTTSLEMEIDEAIFDVYQLSPEERKIIGFIQIT